MSYLWKQSPLLSSAPTEVINHFRHDDGETVFECAVLRLENDKFCFVAFSSDHKDMDEVGVTDIEEFDRLDEAVKLYTESVEE